MPEPTPSDVSTDASASAPVARCPWCSAELPEAEAARCPACHAQLRSDQDSSVPGLTEVLPASVAKAQNQEATKRNRLLSWISGEVDTGEAEPEIPLEAVARPPLDVRREMLRLQLEAEGIITPGGIDEHAVERTEAVTPDTIATGTSGVDQPAAAQNPPAASGTDAPDPAAGAAAVAAGSASSGSAPSDADSELQRAG